MWDSVIKVLGGPLLAKLVLEGVLFGAFLALRRKDTEGAMSGYAILACFLALRDLLFAFLPSTALFGATDIAIFIYLLYLELKPFKLGWPFWTAGGLACAAFVLACSSALGAGLSPSPEALRLAALLPVLALLSLPLLNSSSSATTAGNLSLRTWLPLALGSAVYLVSGSALGVSAPAFQLFVEPAFCGFLFMVALVFVDIRHSQLVSAVDYYEESIDSLYDLLLSTGTAMRSETFLQDVVDNMLRAVVERTGADGGILLLSDEFDETVSVRSLCGTYPPPFKLPENLPKDAERVESFVRHARFKLGEGILGEVSRTGKHVFIPQAGPDSGLPENGDEPWLKAGAFIASPLIVRDRIIGAVSVVKSREGVFSERDFDRCKILANFGSISVANSFSFLEAAERGDIEREADIAASLQADLLPKRFPELRGFAFGVYSSSARGVCSDYYDVIPTRSDRAVVAVGDVAGKGVAASIVLVMVRSILQLITASTKDTATLLQWVNRGITGKVDLDHYATLCLATVEASSGSVELASAGHQPALICRASTGELEAVEAKSVPIGVERGTAYPQTRFALGEGDLLVLYTDGIVETMNAQGRQFSRKGLGEVVQRSRELAPAEIAERIGEELLDFAGQTRSHDDRTVLVLKRLQAR